MIAAVFDTETTGLIENHVVKLDRQPEVIEFSCRLVQWEYPEEVVDTYSELIRPVLGKLPDETKKLTHLTDEDLKDCPTFDKLAADIKVFIERAEVVVGHNLSYDMEMVDLEFERLEPKLRVEWPRLRICTVEQTMHFFGRRMKLEELYRELTKQEQRDAHRALPDVDTTIACLMKMRELDWL
jgi:DNA polymerase-3 subunit epsilon